MFRALAERRPLRAVLVGALIASAYLVVPAAVGGQLTAHADGAVSGAFALGGGMGGSVDPRTGQFSVSIPLVNVASRGDSGIQMNLSWDQGRATAGLDRAGWGGGWSVGTTFIDTDGIPTVYPASGGSYQADESVPLDFESGLRYYVQRDITFAADGGTLPGRDVPGGDPIPDQTYGYTITYTDGRVDYYDLDGNLIARTDRYGNRTDLQYTSPAPEQWQPTAIIDAYGLVTTFDYSQQNAVVVNAPKRSDGLTSSTTVTFDDDGEVSQVQDPALNTASFTYADVEVDNGTQHLMWTATGPAGATSTVTYEAQDYDGGPTVVFAQTLDVDDAAGQPIAETRTFDIDPTDDDLGIDNDFHNYLGYPSYSTTDPTVTTDGLYESVDDNYFYSTMISTPSAATINTYDSAHRLASRSVLGASNNGNLVPVTTQSATYQPVQPINDQPANYAKPLTSTVQYLSRSGPNGYTATGTKRSETTTTSYDDFGRIVKAIDEVDTTTAYTYDSTYGLPTSIVITGDDGTVRTTTNTLTDDKKSVYNSIVAIGDDGPSVSARSVSTYAFDQYGEPQSRTVTWAPGAAPATGDGGGPSTATTTYASTIDGSTKKLTITQAAGTPSASSTTSTIDLVDQKVVSFTDAMGRVTSSGYDANGRLVKLTPPTGLTTTTSYTQATGTKPATMVRSTADGHQVVTSYDALGRVTSVRDNVQNGAFVATPVRTVSSHVYAANRITGGSGARGTTLISTDVAGRVTKTVTDGLGKTILETAANGVTNTTTYDDALNTVTRQTLPDNASQASQVVKTGYDAMNRQVSSRTTYPVDARNFTLDPVELASWDGIGRQASATAKDLVSTPDFSGAGGVAETVTVAPAETARVQSAPITANDTSMIDGQTTHRQLQQPGQDARSGTQLGYDAAGRLTSATDPLGRATTYTYYDDGQVHTSTSPSGTVTTQTFDAAGRVQTVTAKAAGGQTTSTTATYVPAGKPGAGHLASMTDSTGTVSYAYDADGNRTTISYPDGSSSTNDYDDDGLLDTSTDVTGAVTSYLYFPDTSLKSATQTRNGATLASVAYTYDGLGRQKTTTRGNGLVTTNTYTSSSMLSGQTTVDGKGNQVEAHSYAYDTHHNLVTKTSTTAKPTNCTVICVAGANTFGTWTSTYRYDAYDRLVGSSVYSGAKATGLPLTDNAYVLDVSGNVTTTTRTSRTTGFKPTTTKQVIKDQVDGAGQLTQRTTGSTVASQKYDDDGRVNTALNGATTTYRPDGLPASVAQGGSTTTFGYWADGTRRRATTVDPAQRTTTTEFHYAPDGTLANDTTTTSGTGPSGSASATYLVTTGREARTLLPGTTAAGAVKTKAAAAPVTSGAGVGYFLRDRHSSVTALVDSTGAVTNTYSYGDYGAPALLSGKPGSVVGATPGTTAGTTNPLRYTGAALKSLYTDAALGTMMTPARFYDPSQGRFTARDSANIHNRYIGFDTNPIMKVDPTGQSALADFFIDAIYVIVFAVAVYVTGGAALSAAPAIFGAEAATTATAAAASSFAAEAVAATANAVGLAANATRFSDDLDNAVSGQHFLNDDQRSDLSNVATVAGSVAGVAGMFTGGASAATTAATAADKAAAPVDAAATGLADPEADLENNWVRIAPTDDELATDQMDATDADDGSGFPGWGDPQESSNDTLLDFSPEQEQALHGGWASSKVGDSPGAAATVKKPISAEQLNDQQPPPASGPQAGKKSVLRNAWDTLTGKAAAEAAKAKEDADMRLFLQEMHGYIRTDTFAASKSNGVDSELKSDISSLDAGG